MVTCQRRDWPPCACGPEHSVRTLTSAPLPGGPPRRGSQHARAEMEKGIGVVANKNDKERDKGKKKLTQNQYLNCFVGLEIFWNQRRGLSVQSGHTACH